MIHTTTGESQNHSVKPKEARHKRIQKRFCHEVTRMQNGPVTPEVSACLWGGRIAWKEERGDFSGVMEMFDVSFF